MGATKVHLVQCWCLDWPVNVVCFRGCCQVCIRGGATAAVVYYPATSERSKGTRQFGVRPSGGDKEAKREESEFECVPVVRGEDPKEGFPGLFCLRMYHETLNDRALPSRS